MDSVDNHNIVVYGLGDTPYHQTYRTPIITYNVPQAMDINLWKIPLFPLSSIPHFHCNIMISRILILLSAFAVYVIAAPHPDVGGAAYAAIGREAPELNESKWLT
ncbi:hypothetical protein BDR07DRAFT_1427213 [Suillus spraguei]|nr:hypothetical protein BDR07DRAFT_1427213 [Suillus spraguei]